MSAKDVEREGPHATSLSGNPEYITVKEAQEITGFDERTLKNLAKKAGITRIGRNSFDRKEFFRYWKARTIIEDEPKNPNEESWEKLDRINKVWRDLII